MNTFHFYTTLSPLRLSVWKSREARARGLSAFYCPAILLNLLARCLPRRPVLTMNITKENFETSFEEICEAIRASHFIALDTEFTGEKIKILPIRVYL